MTDQDYIRQLRTPTAKDPLRILMSACLGGDLCGYDGTNNGVYLSARRLFDYSTSRIVKFCPEDYSFGSPREMCDIHGGTGLDVLEDRAKVLSDSGEDWSEGMIKASERMLAIAQEEQIEIAVMMDISAACGSQVIYDGNRFSKNKKYRIGAGVAAAQLIRNGFKVISQRDFASLELLYSKLDPEHSINRDAIDHHETNWYKGYFEG